MASAAGLTEHYQHVFAITRLSDFIVTAVDRTLQPATITLWLRA